MNKNPEPAKEAVALQPVVSRHLAWPKLKRDYDDAGLKVILLKPMRTVGGAEFRKGQKMKVLRYHRGLRLKSYRGEIITRVNQADVKLVSANDPS